MKILELLPGNITKKSFDKIFANMIWLFIDKLVRVGGGFLVMVWVARYLGPLDFGHLNYAIAFAALFSTVASLGLDNIAVRELVNNPAEKEKILGSVFFLKLIGGITALMFSSLFICLVRPNDNLSFILVFIIALGFLFEAFAAIDIWFQSQLLSKYTVWVRNFVFFVASLLKIACILLKGPLIAFAIIATFEVIVGFVGLIIPYRAKHLRIRVWVRDSFIIRGIFRDSWPLMLSGLCQMIYLRINQVLIGQFMNDRAVGIYSAAANLTEMWYFIPMLIAPSVFPAVLNTKKKGEDLYAKRMQMLYDFMAFISILIAVTVFIFSKTIVHIFYGEQYLEASPVLSIYAWTTIPIFLGVASSQFLVAENLTKISFYRTLFGSIASIFLNLILIPRYGIKGAAWAVLISFVITVFSIFFFKRAVGHGLQLLRSLNPFRLISYIPVKKPS